MPGWSGLANARVTMFGDVYQLSDDLQRGAREVSSRGHPFCTLTAYVHLATSFRCTNCSGSPAVSRCGSVQWQGKADAAVAAADRRRQMNQPPYALPDVYLSCSSTASVLQSAHVCPKWCAAGKW